MKRQILLSFLFLLACIGYSIAGYGEGTPGVDDPWTWYGGYERYYDRDRYNYYPDGYYNSITRPYRGRGGGGYGYGYDSGYYGGRGRGSGSGSYYSSSRYPYYNNRNSYYDNNYYY